MLGLVGLGYAELANEAQIKEGVSWLITASSDAQYWMTVEVRDMLSGTYSYEFKVIS